MSTSSVAVVSAGVPGRARLHVPELRGQAALGFQIRERLGGDERVREVRASAVTGNVLIHFDADRLDLAEIRRRVAREARTYRPIRGLRTADMIPPASDAPPWDARERSEVVRALRGDPDAGLSAQEADSRLATSGPNRLPAPQPKSGIGACSSAACSCAA